MMITERDLESLAEEYGVECDVAKLGDTWTVAYEWGVEEYASGEEACEAIRAYGKRD